MGLPKQLVDASVETFDYAVGLRVTRRCQPMLGRQACAGDVESMFAAGLLVFVGEAAGKLRDVVGEDLIDFDRRGQLEPTQKINTACLSHISIDMHENPACCTIDGSEQIAARGLVLHLWQYLISTWMKPGS
ncbi:hypothetical protein [uncultured Massilia sp.]|uniref:hypothetical protein n=1 Tax=uncultured Massilia sp. TaxID=169973 RepID=UPI0035A3C448